MNTTINTVTNNGNCAKHDDTPATHRKFITVDGRDRILAVDFCATCAKAERNGWLEEIAVGNAEKVSPTTYVDTDRTITVEIVTHVALRRTYGKAIRRESIADENLRAVLISWTSTPAAEDRAADRHTAAAAALEVAENRLTGLI